jgi:hypothetical protein
MRKVLFPVLAAGIMLMLTAPARAQEPGPVQSIVGTWEGQTDIVGMTMTVRNEFRANGTFQSILKTSISGISSFVVTRGKYTYSDGVLTTSGKIHGGILNNFPVSEVGTVEWLDANRFTYTAGLEMTFRRLR